MQVGLRVVAVDWSGDARQARRHIWLAEAIEPGQLARLESGRDRRELSEHLLEETLASASGKAAPVSSRNFGTKLPATSLAIGLDFAFSFPAWFLASIGVRTAPELWAYAGDHGEGWLAACAPPFWGRPGRSRPTALEAPAWRRAERAVPPQAGITPKSVFQVGGSGAVGTGSIRGMPLLNDLHLAGATIWPFTDGGPPLVVEIYPRLLTGPVHKSSPTARAALLERRYPRLASEHRRLATTHEDAFDAAVSALVMVEYADDLATLPLETDPWLRREGRIWHPGWRDDRL